MVKQSMDAGVTHMVCTPHIHMGYFDNDQTTIDSAFQQLVQAKAELGLALKLAYSAEIRICPEIMQWVMQKQLPFLGEYEGKQVLLIELPHSHIPPGTENLLRWLHKQNIQPVIAHPERNRDILASYNKISPLRKCECLFQVTAGSITGRFSEQVQALALQMLNDDIVTYVASDTHNLNRRPNDMGLSFVAVERDYGIEKAQQLHHDMPLSICSGKTWL